MHSAGSRSLRCVAVRLAPGEDLRGAIGESAKAHAIGARCVISAAGSLKVAALRFAGASDASRIEGPFEILSLSGTVGGEGVHLHAAVADRRGAMLGGHVGTGCEVHTTVEIVIAVLEGLRFERRHDAGTGHRELRICSE